MADKTKSRNKIQQRRPRIHPKIRERRSEVIKQKNKKRLIFVIAVAVMILALIVFIVVVYSPITQVTDIVVQGNQHESDTQVLQAANLYQQKPQLFLLNYGQVQKDIQNLPWVLSDQIKKNWPNQIIITIKDRTEIGQINMGKAGFALVDEYGRILQIQSQAIPNLLEIDNLGSHLIPGQNLGAFDIGALNVAKIVPSILGPIATKEIVESDNSISVVLGSNNTIYLGSASDIRQKLLEALAIVNHGSLLPNQTVDVSIPNSPVVTSSSIVNSRNG